MSNAWEIINAKIKNIASRYWKTMDILIDVLSELREKNKLIQSLQARVDELEQCLKDWVDQAQDEADEIGKLVAENEALRKSLIVVKQAVRYLPQEPGE